MYLHSLHPPHTLLNRDSGWMSLKWLRLYCTVSLTRQLCNTRCDIEMSWMWACTYMLDDMAMDYCTGGYGCLLLQFSYSSTQFPSRLLKEIVHPTMGIHSWWCSIVCFQFTVSSCPFQWWAALNLLLIICVAFALSISQSAFWGDFQLVWARHLNWARFIYPWL